MSNLNILGMSSITNSGTLEVMVADPNNPTLDIRTTLPVGGGGGGSVTLYDQDAHTITNIGTIAVASGGTISGTSGGVGTISGFGGGGGGSYVGGLGIDVITNAGTGTINNTGTIVQPTGAVAYGITLHANLLQAPGTGSYSAASLSVYGGSTTLANTAGTGAAGTMLFDSGSAYSAVLMLAAPDLLRGARSFKGHRRHWELMLPFTRGKQPMQSTNLGGQMAFQGANATGGETATGGGIVISPGVGSGAATLNTTGLLTVNNLPTADPHQLGALWVLDTLTGAAAISQG